MPVIEIYPLPTPLVGRISPEAWATTPVSIKSEIIRAWQELAAGIAIAKDKRCGRPKSHRSSPLLSPSFYELHLLDTDIWKFPTNTVKIERAEALRAALAPDVERMQQNDDLLPYHEMAVKSGTTLARALQRYINMEQLLKEDLGAGIVVILEQLGIDPIKFLTDYLASHPADAAA